MSRVIPGQARRPAPDSERSGRPAPDSARAGHAAPDPVRAIADAVLYEGYILWPYRRSALKNQRRFTFGGVYPPAWTALHPDDPSSAQTEVLLCGPPETTLSVSARFLHIVERQAVDREGTPVDELSVGDQRHLSWEEASEREILVGEASLGSLSHHARTVPIEQAAGSAAETLLTEDGAPSGALVRTWQGLDGTVSVRTSSLGDGVWRVCASVENTTELPAGADRQAALARTFCSTHVLLRASGGTFVSLADPPPALREAAMACENLGGWPVPVGEPDDWSTVLFSPIILEDHPRIAPESPGDLFDGGEIDQLLILNILTLTDEEKAEMVASDPRAREILERSESLTPEELMRLHGMVRETEMLR